MKTESVSPEAIFQSERIAHWDSVAMDGRDLNKGMRGKYHDLLKNIYKFLITEKHTVLELGCAEGDLLAALNPSLGVGVDFSSEMIKLARQHHPDLHFIVADAENIGSSLNEELLSTPFDFIILSDLVNDVWDVLELLKRVRTLCDRNTRVILNYHSHLWEFPFRLMQRTAKLTPRLKQNWLTVGDMDNLMDLAGFEAVRSFDEILFPFGIPVIEPLFNRYLAKLWPFSIFDLTHFQIFRLAHSPDKEGVVSVIVPARNEAGNIEDAMARIPEMGAGTEIIFVEGNSTDNTWQVVNEAMARHPERRCKAMQQPGKGKYDAVKTGFAAAEGDILMILDADLTVPPEVLPQFYEAIAQNNGEFINGVRLVYPQEKEAMRFCNLLGNKFFSLAFSWLLSANIKDTLCGTKVLSRRNYEKIAANRAYFGDFDPFGDFDLLFGASKLNLKIVDLPVRYRERTYGDTNISRWRDGWTLLRMFFFALRRIKFRP